MSQRLAEKIKRKKAVIAVVGLGYVGLPLAVAFAQKGFCVLGIDSDKSRIQKLRKKQSYILDVSAHDIARVLAKKKLAVSTDFYMLHTADVVLVCVPTPLKRKYTPDISYIIRAIRAVRRYMKKDTLIVLESTTYPGTTDELVALELEKTGLKAGKDFYLAFSPERIDPGNKAYGLRKIPKIVGGVNPIAGRLTKMLYGTIIKKVHVVSSARAAEMTKLLENSFRIINIAWVNEVAMMCHKLHIDVWEVIEAAKTKPFGFMPFYPGLGVGGHCIPDDPLYLYWKARLHGFRSRLIKISADINTLMPQYAIERIRAIVRAQKKTLRMARVLVVGVTYKKDVKDLRKSPSLKLIEQLQAARCRVRYFDPIIPYLDIGSIKLKSVALNKDTVSRYDCVVIATDHTRINYRQILKHARVIFDIKNAYKGLANKKVVRL